MPLLGGKLKKKKCYLGVNIYTKMEQSPFNPSRHAEYPRKLDKKQVVVGKNLTTELEMKNITTIESMFASTYRFSASYTNLDMNKYPGRNLFFGHDVPTKEFPISIPCHSDGKYFQGTRC